MFPKFLRRKPEAPVEVAEGETPPAELLLTEVAPKPAKTTNLMRFKITVPVGHVLPEGETVKTAFPMTIEVGVRWHPEWAGPQITVTGFRFFPQGDCLCWSGQSLTDAFGLLLPADVAMLVPYHGQPYPAEGKDEDALMARVAIKSMGITPPTAKEKLADFILPEQLGATRH